MYGKYRSGFTLLETMVVIALVAVLAVLAMPAYEWYVERARSSEVLAKYDAMRTKIGAERYMGTIGPCSEIAEEIAPENLAQDYARLTIDFQQVDSDPLQGYRPVLLVCAREKDQGSLGVKVARALHQEFDMLGVLESKAILTPTTVSFAAALTDDNRAMCRVPTGSAYTACGDPAAVPPGVAVVAPPTPTPAAVVAPQQLPIAVPKVRAYVMKFDGSNVYLRPSGGRLNTGGDLSAFTLDMSFIGDGSIPAASGGQGPVMFNYGDSSNAHNAISLWNPRSLTVALHTGNYDTGLNVVDGKTHRVTVSWDSATGELSVYDNGLPVKTFSGVGQGSPIKGNGFMVVAHKGEPGQYSAGEAFTGQIFGTTLASRSVTAGEAQTPLNQLGGARGDLLVDMRVDQGSGQVVDTTGRHQVESGGVTAELTGVEGNLVNSNP